MRFVIRIQLYKARSIARASDHNFLPFFSQLLVNPQDGTFCITLSLKML